MQNTPTKELTAADLDLILWHLTDSALPTGSFAHSAGMEMYLQRDLVTNADTYSIWLNGYIRELSYNEALLARFACEIAQADMSSAQRQEQIALLDRMGAAALMPKQVRDSMRSMGRRMSKIAATVLPEVAIIDVYASGIDEDLFHGSPAIVFGLALGSVGVDVETCVRAFLMQQATSMTQNAIRGIPLGQDAGQRVLVDAYPAIQQTAALTLAHTEADLGATAPGLELNQMMHEGLHARMFMS
ncbi:urease accessory protein UreF [Corynebacterium caspium]|uniref:urease accessory protein UreF n=1 Tax=Corynebacterium caspium TaxID=234828 RepID=UPI00035F278C|nr:urease accessory UreF family protein [Corynebacterium caspium]WKD58625.1 Urease accessory protein UreF [Corynebacterium caspium DSM 44850]